MNIIVQKYGGSSVKNKTSLKNICKRVKSYLKNNNTKLVIIVSAQGKKTDELIKLSKSYSSSIDLKSLDFLLCTGEMQTAALLSMMLNESNIKAVPLTGWQAGIITDSNFGEAKILNIFSENILRNLEKYSVVIVTGFQGNDKFGNITTLGRGGSDLSATAIASKLNATSCEIYSDINGIFTTDPNVEATAKMLKNISYDEMIEAASSGAKVMHNRSVLVAKKYNLQIQVSNSKFLEGSIESGTKISNDTTQNDIIEDNKVKLITKKDNLTQVSIIGEMIMSNINIINKIYQTADLLNVKIYMITFSELAIHIITDTSSSEKFITSLHKKIITET